MIRWPRTCRRCAGRDWAEGATLRDLLANRSGLPLRDGLEFGFAGRTDEDDGALSRLAADVAAAVPAGAFWSYTNVGWCLLGRVIETVTDAAWEDAMRRHFAGVGMRETTFATGAVTTRRASGHEVTADGPVPVEPLARARVRTGRHDCRLDGRGSSSVRRRAPRGLVARRVACRARGGLDPRLAGLLVPRLGPVRLGGWSGVGMGRRRQRRAVSPADRAGTSGRRRPDDQRQHRACDVPLARSPI